MAKTKRQKLIDKCDDLVRKILRIRDRHKDGYYYCVTCDKRLHYGNWNAANVGHYRVRKSLCTRWHLKNVHIQCNVCNIDDGEQYLHGLRIDEMYGEGWADRLIQLSHQTCKLGVVELEAIKETLEDKLIELE